MYILLNLKCRYYFCNTLASSLDENPKSLNPTTHLLES